MQAHFQRIKMHVYAQNTFPLTKGAIKRRNTSAYREIKNL